MATLFLLGRILFGGFFVYNGYGHIKNLEGTTGYAKSKGVPFAKLSVLVSGIVLVLGGIGVMFLFHVRFALFILASFLIVTTYMMHQFWKVSDPMHKMSEQIAFQKNVALLGAIFMLMVLL